MNFHEIAMNQIKTFQVHNKSPKWWTLTNNHELNNATNQAHNNLSQFMRQSLVNVHELAMNPFMTYQVHNNSSSSWNSLMNFHEHAMNWIDPTKFKKCITVRETRHMNSMN